MRDQFDTPCFLVRTHPLIRPLQNRDLDLPADCCIQCSCCCAGVNARFLLNRHSLPLHGRHLSVDTRGSDPRGADTRGSDPYGSSSSKAATSTTSQPFASLVSRVTAHFGAGAPLSMAQTPPDRQRCTAGPSLCAPAHLRTCLGSRASYLMLLFPAGAHSVHFRGSRLCSTHPQGCAISRPPTWRSQKSPGSIPRRCANERTRWRERPCSTGVLLTPDS